MKSSGKQNLFDYVRFINFLVEVYPINIRSGVFGTMAREETAVLVERKFINSKRLIKGIKVRVSSWFRSI